MIVFVITNKQILTANDVACELFGFTERSIVGVLLTDILKTTSRQHAAAAETLLELSGDMLQLSAIVVCITCLLAGRHNVVGNYSNGPCFPSVRLSHMDISETKQDRHTVTRKVE